MRIAVDVARPKDWTQASADRQYRRRRGQTVHHLHLHVLGGRALGPLLETT
jgi:diadenosine tetraphosphate (Ap4A) HIT family hydrolase